MADRIHVAAISFVGEQDGVAEQKLKQALRATLQRFPDVQRAYLARVVYREAGQSAVALCIYGTTANLNVVDECGLEFQRIFNRAVHLDILFLTEAQDLEVRRVCQPFHVNKTAVRHHTKSALSRLLKRR